MNESSQAKKEHLGMILAYKPVLIVALLPAQSLPGRCQSNLSPRSKVACEFSVVSAEFSAAHAPEEVISHYPTLL